MTMPQEPRPRSGDRDHRLHDVDLVAAYAGDDPGIDRDAAAALVAVCPDCRSEFALQRQVAAWLSTAPTVSLDAEERSGLHDRVNQAIAEPAVVSLAERRSRRQPGQLLFRLGTAAAAVAVIASIGGVFNNVGGDGGEVGFQTIATELAAESDETTTMAAAATTTAANFAAGSSERAMLTGGDAAAVAREIEELLARSASEESAGAPAETQADAMASAPPCVDEVEDREIILTAESVLDGEPIIVFIVAGEENSDAAGSETEVPEALIFEIADCSPIDLG
jgi:hypothetical protein